MSTASKRRLWVKGLGPSPPINAVLLPLLLSLNPLATTALLAVREVR